MSKNEFISLVHRYLNGECTSSEISRIRECIEESPENLQTFEEIKKIWDVKPDKELHADLGEAWNRLEGKMFEKKGVKTPYYRYARSVHQRNRSGRLYAWMRVAAILVVGALLTLVAIQISGGGFFAGPADSTQEEIAMQEVRADRGHQSRMTFSDGSEVRLNSASTIRFPQQFDADVREVWLEGEAWFNVQHNPDVEFIVRTSEATVRVLGTEFNVKAYQEEPEVEIVVVNGLVTVRAADANERDSASEVRLHKGEMSRVLRGEGPSEARSVNIESYLSWTRGTFVFDETPFARVLAEWERRFNVHFEIENETLLATPFTGEFRYESFDEMLRLTSIALDFEYKRTNQTITINNLN